MALNSLAANGVPDNFDTITSEELKNYRIASGYLLRPARVLRLLEPHAYYAGLAWECEEILKVQHDKMKNRYNYYSGYNSNMGPEVNGLSEIEYSEELQLNMIKNLFLQQKGNITVSGSQLHLYNTPEPVHSPVSEVQETDTVQSFMNQSATNATEGAVNSDEATNHDEPHTSMNCSSQSSLECRKEESQQGTKQASCSDTQNVFSVCCNNGESGISRNKVISGFHNRCHEHINKNKAIEGTEVSRSENKYTDSLSQDTTVKEEQQNFNNSPVSWVYSIQEVHQEPVIHLTAQPYNMLEHST